jgi:hypothetical protein
MSTEKAMIPSMDFLLLDFFMNNMTAMTATDVYDRFPKF